MKTCDIAECNEPVSAGSKHTTCENCRRSFYYWRKRRPAQLLDRRRKLTKYADRLDNMLDHKVISIRRKHA